MIWVCAFFIGGFLVVAACGWALERLELEDGALAKLGRIAVITIGVAVWLPWILLFGNPDGPRF
jgi:hypothetical protein